MGYKQVNDKHGGLEGQREGERRGKARERASVEQSRQKRTTGGGRGWREVNPGSGEKYIRFAWDQPSPVAVPDCQGGSEGISG
jgi:hypothetical protein